MPDKEIPLQYEMFTGELVDTRTRAQKRRDRQRELPRQLPMFDTPTTMEQARSRHNYDHLVTRDGRPLLLSLMMQDPRSEEEIEEAQMRAAEAQTYPLFTEGKGLPDPQTMTFPSKLELPVREVEEPEPQLAVVLFDEADVLVWSTRDEAYERLRDGTWQRGYRAYLVGDDQLEVWDREPDPAGYYLVTYSSMGMIENIEWVRVDR